ncbi:MAG: hypothetical protein OEY93_03740, partial [Anaerolineae bacterium]|nr:hypothetical protein [Anaerolineae bacterium]
LDTSAFLYPAIATAAKIKDRMAPEAPRSLNGMAYMGEAVFFDKNVPLDLSADYDAIQWMQANIKGSPVIVEAITPLYMWGSRYSINTGLPAVLGWDWHQTQQRIAAPGHWIPERRDGVKEFFTTTNVVAAREFLETYGVKYIIVGQLERVYYEEEGGLEKFTSFEGQYWKKVFTNKQVVIYQVIGK